MVKKYRNKKSQTWPRINQILCNFQQIRFVNITNLKRPEADLRCFVPLSDRCQEPEREPHPIIIGDEHRVFRVK